jgi:hypothetical protein
MRHILVRVVEKEAEREARPELAAPNNHGWDKQ